MNCCDMMRTHLAHQCQQHGDGDCPDRIIQRTDTGIGIPIHDGGSSFIAIRFCPWCGSAVEPGKELLDEASEEPVRSIFVVQNIGWGTHVRLVRAKDNIEARRIANSYGGSDEVNEVFQNGPAEVLFEYEYCPDTGE